MGQALLFDSHAQICYNHAVFSDMTLPPLQETAVRGFGAPLRVVLVGAGSRAMIYGQVALDHPELLQVTGAVDTDPQRLEQARQAFSLREDQCFSCVEELVAHPRLADAAINATMDRYHVATSLPLLRHGYDLLLEKPFATHEAEARELLNCVRETGRQVMVCHVLRYTPFYRQIKTLLSSGAIGDVIHIQMAEQVSFFHESVSFVRGKFATPDLGASSMLLAKCSHDLDMLAWLMAGNPPARISSTGSVFQFKPEQAPEQAGFHCLNDCPIERACPYSSRTLYIEHPQRWANNVWHDHNEHPRTDEEKERILRQPDNPFSRCVYRCPISVVDHQALLIRFQNGATGTFSMVGGAAAPARHIHITGTRGEIRGVFEERSFHVSFIDPEAPGGYTTKHFQFAPAQTGDAHGGGDQELVRDFIHLLSGEPISFCCTTLDDSVTGLRMALLAEQSRLAQGAMLAF